MPLAIPSIVFPFSVWSKELCVDGLVRGLVQAGTLAAQCVAEQIGQFLEHGVLTRGVELAAFRMPRRLSGCL